MTQRFLAWEFTFSNRGPRVLIVEIIRTSALFWFNCGTLFATQDFTSSVQFWDRILSTLLTKSLGKSSQVSGVASGQFVTAGLTTVFIVLNKTLGV